MQNILLYAAFALGVLSTVLHFIAPRTANTIDDKAAEIVDDVAKVLPEPPPSK